MILLIDSYDSFAYNLYQLIGEMTQDIRVIRNDEMTAEEIRALAPSHIVLSPGPGRPERAGVLTEVVKMLGEEIPVLGVCLGHQAVCAAYGGVITYAKKLMHGKTSVIRQDGRSPLFRDCPAEMTVARYHSLAAEEASLPDCLRVTARALDGEVMAVQHVTHPVYGVQFHPESVMTPQGKQFMENFIGRKNA
ncbi:MAG: aminodeoxychorismate/anthranilate synthase component II [Lachnospiraceae bacterium]|nr:aminodeoxychorismate/anthranilate synthase component II [Lachnospiraceae bacterium]